MDRHGLMLLGSLFLLGACDRHDSIDTTHTTGGTVTAAPPAPTAGAGDIGRAGSAVVLPVNNIGLTARERAARSAIRLEQAVAEEVVADYERECEARSAARTEHTTRTTGGTVLAAPAIPTAGANDIAGASSGDEQVDTIGFTACECEVNNIGLTARERAARSATRMKEAVVEEVEASYEREREARSATPAEQWSSPTDLEMTQGTREDLVDTTRTTGGTVPAAPVTPAAGTDDIAGVGSADEHVNTIGFTAREHEVNNIGLTAREREARAAIRMAQAVVEEVEADYEREHQALSATRRE